METSEMYNLDELLADDDSFIQTNIYKKEDDFKIIDKIILKYFSNEYLNEDLIYKINYDLGLKKTLLEIIEHKLDFMNKSNDIYLFKDLKMIFNLLSLGNSINLFQNIDNSNISELLTKYEKLLKELFTKDKNNFDLSLEYYFCLLNSFLNLFNLYKDNFNRRDNISSIIDILIESINSIKMSFKLTSKQMKILAIYQAKVLIEYSNFNYVDHNNEDDLIEKYKFIINKHIDGYFLLSNFEDDLDLYKDSYLENVTRSMFLLLMKLNKLDSYDFSKLDHLIYMYNTDIKQTDKNFYDEESLKNDLFANYALIFNKKELFSNSIIVEKILSLELSAINLRILHDIVLYEDNFSIKEYLNIFNVLLSMKELENNKNECLKLKILDLLIHKFIKYGEYEYFFPYSLKLKEYLLNKENKSFKISYLSKLHLSLSYYYTFLDKKYISYTEEEYYLSEKISSFNYVKEHNKKLFKKILLNYTKKYFEFILENNNFTFNESLLIADTLMKNSFMIEEIKEKYKIEEISSEFISRTLNKPNVNEFTLKKDLTKELNETIFFKEEIFKVLYNDEDIDIDYELFDKTIFVNYKIISKKDKKILKLNKEYLVNKIREVIILFFLKMKKAKYYNNFLQIDEYISL